MAEDTTERRDRLTTTLAGQLDEGTEALPALTTLVDQALQMVTTHIGTATVPDVIADLAIIEVARELHTRQQAPGGILSPYADAAPVRLARDPMKAAYPILAPYLPLGLA